MCDVDVVLIRVQDCKDAYHKMNGMMMFGSKLKLSPLDIEG